MCSKLPKENLKKNNNLKPHIYDIYLIFCVNTYHVISTICKDELLFLFFFSDRRELVFFL